MEATHLARTFPPARRRRCQTGGHRRQPFGLGRERSVTFLLAPDPEFPEPAGAVSAGVFRLGAVECVRHSPVLTFRQAGRCIILLLRPEGHLRHFLSAV